MVEQADDAHPAHWLSACELAARCFRQKKRCLVMCADQVAAEAFDNLLWQQPLNAFVPHNLTGEGPAGGAPVEITWPNNGYANRPILINLSDQMPQNGQKFRQIYDFVPAAEDAKQLARERYKHYRAAGFQMSTEAANSINEKQDG